MKFTYFERPCKDLILKHHYMLQTGPVKDELWDQVSQLGAAYKGKCKMVKIENKDENHSIFVSFNYSLEICVSYSQIVLESVKNMIKHYLRPKKIK